MTESELRTRDYFGSQFEEFHPSWQEDVAAVTIIYIVFLKSGVVTYPSFNQGNLAEINQTMLRIFTRCLLQQEGILTFIFPFQMPCKLIL